MLFDFLSTNIVSKIFDGCAFNGLHLANSLQYVLTISLKLSPLKEKKTFYLTRNLKINKAAVPSKLVIV